ncbi:MAG TPA: helix-turn-helix transcriptional regulator [Candidatus Eisenbacteria bacterium]|nr:helix-turn-helix transcriptional regulator [Candidatus Eisenbacteria bacterium]
MYPPGLRLRQARETLGLTYREVAHASYEIAARRGRPDFILHISRLADIENRNVVPSLHKLYSLATIYHLSPWEICGWYEAPFLQTFEDGTAFPSPRTHLHELRAALGTGARGLMAADSEDTSLRNEFPERMSPFPGMHNEKPGRYRYGYIGLSDRRMTPILRPGSIVLVDTALRHIEDADWFSEYDRPLYFVETRGGYRCGWFQKLKSRLVMQPHTLSHCTPEVWRTPEEAEVVGKVVGVTTYLNEPWSHARELPRTTPAN